MQESYAGKYKRKTEWRLDMICKDLFTMKSPYRQPMVIKGYSFGKGEPSACIMGAERGNEMQQMYICSQLVRILKELENNGAINNNKEILVIPTVNPYSINAGKKFWCSDDLDINRMFPGNHYGDTTSRIAAGIMDVVKEYTYGIQFASFYMSGEFVPHIRMMETGFQNASLANLFGLPYVVIRRPKPIDTKTLNYNWQTENTAAFSVYTNTSATVDEKSATQAVAAVLRFLTRMGIIKYESHSGYISHVIQEEELSNVHNLAPGFLRKKIAPGEEVKYGQIMAEILDPYEGNVVESIQAPTDGIVFYAHNEPLVGEGEIVFSLIHRLHL